jgi:hypothetical protein
LSVVRFRLNRIVTANVGPDLSFPEARLARILSTTSVKQLGK